MERYNEAALDKFNTKVLEKCNGCGRTFNPEALIRHQKSCKGYVPEDKPPAIAQRPKALMCYICGREYGTASLEIHLKTCKKKWEIEQSKKPVNQRRPIPQPPKDFDKIVSGEITGSAMGRYNEGAFDEYNNVGLEPCSNCGRTFNPDALKIHQKSCLRGQQQPEEQKTTCDET